MSSRLRQHFRLAAGANFWTDRLPYLRAFASNHRVLHLGPGTGEHIGITVDRLPEAKPTVLMDLDSFPYPFRDRSFDAIYAFSVIEHLDDLVQTMTELHRLLRPGGFVAVLTPHFSNDGSYVDPTHRSHLSARSFDYFVDGTEVCSTYGFYSNVRFRLRTRLLMLQPPWRWIPGLQATINDAVAFYERHLCFLLRAEGVYFELEVVTS
jgi:SAM-dependent methyltransferase